MRKAERILNSEDELEQEEESTEATDTDSSSTPTAVSFDDQEFVDVYASRAAISAPTYCEFLSGAAGTGKSFEILRRIEEDPEYAVLSASTGIAAVNLGATTIHSLLGFFDLNSLKDAYLRKSAQRSLRSLVTDGYRNVVLDEVSMVSHQMLDTLVNIFDDVNDGLKEGQKPVGLILVGDMAQLPPIVDRAPGERAKRGQSPPIPWAFDAACWHRFEENTTHLTKVWRQTDQQFLAALNHARAGRGRECTDILATAGVEFHTYVDMEFDGTTILAKNDEVDAYNLEAMKRVAGRDMFLPSRRWGKERSEWKKIPAETRLRENAYVMLLANMPGATRGSFEYVNGDCGHVRGITTRGPGRLPLINVELVRTGQIVKVPAIVRAVDYREKPDGFAGDLQVSDEYYPRPHRNSDKKRYVSGQVQYYPIRLAYATTCHKAQGLTLDKVQVDVRTWQFQNPGMTYIAMSRCRTLEGLRLVGQKEVVAEKCKSDERVKRWL